MKEQELQFEKMNSIISETIEKMPMPKEKVGWNDLAQRLDNVIPAKAPSKGKWFKNISMNTWILSSTIILSLSVAFSIVAFDRFSQVNTAPKYKKRKMIPVFNIKKNQPEFLHEKKMNIEKPSKRKLPPAKAQPDKIMTQPNPPQSNPDESLKPIETTKDTFIFW